MQPIKDVQPIKTVGVVGAGVMGSGIAAHMANAGIRVTLLDIVPPDLPNPESAPHAQRSRFAGDAIKKTLKSKPAAFFHPDMAKLVATGNLEDDLDSLKNADLIIEAIIERIDIKKKLFARLEDTISSDTIVASNTSGLRIADMLEGRNDSFRERFLVMHFFNPVRYMKLLELVAGPDTSDQVRERVETFGRELLGKGIVWGKDTPNFIGNRIGCHSMMLTLKEMQPAGLSIEDVDAITGVPMGHPKSASFRTADMVGLDTFAHVASNCHAALVDDEERDVFLAPEFLTNMVDKKILGDKTRGGFYKKTKDGILTIDPSSLEYRPKGGDPELKKAMKDIAKKEDPAERVRALVADSGKAGAFAWKLLSRSLLYSARRVGEIADDVVACDDAMKWGYNWELGPFEIWDALGFSETLTRMRQDGLDIPSSIERMENAGATSFYRPGEVFDLARGAYVEKHEDPRTAPLVLVRQRTAPVVENAGASAWDLGEGVLGVTFKTKANSIDADVIGAIHQSVDRAERDFSAVLLYNEGDHFCVGANLFAIVMAANQKQWDQLRNTVQGFQGAVQRMKYATVPVVAAPYGMTLGGGLELCLASDAVQASAETYAGLVEAGVGVIPGGAGNLNMLWRALEGIPDGVEFDVQAVVGRVFQNIATARVATSAHEAIRFGYVPTRASVSFDRARHLSEAKALAASLGRTGYHPPAPRSYRLPGESGIATLGMMVDTMVAGSYATEHDALIARKLATVLCGGPGGATKLVTEEHMLELEAEAFVSLCGEPKSLERMQHMLMHNKPLRN